VFDRTLLLPPRAADHPGCFIGILSALSLQLSASESGILRAIGLTIRQLWGLIMLETGCWDRSRRLPCQPVSCSPLSWFTSSTAGFDGPCRCRSSPSCFLAQPVAWQPPSWPESACIPTGKIAAADAIRFE
jgi:hypothetical protein